MQAEQLIEKVKHFPPLDDTITKVLAICDDPNASLAQLTEVIQSDPLTMANILKGANNPGYDFNKKITNISQAISLFGMESIKSFALATFLEKIQDINLSPYNVDTKQFKTLTQAQNAFVTNWYKGNKQILDTVTLASYIMESGKIIIAKTLIETFSQNIFADNIKEANTLQDVSNIEKEIFDMSSEEVSAALLKKWKFPEPVYQSILYSINPKNAPKEFTTYANILYVTKLIINIHNFDTKNSLKEAVDIVKKYNLNPNKFIKTYKQYIHNNELAMV